MSLSRRSFIGSLVGGIFTAAEVIADPDKLLWVPKLISIPSPHVITGTEIEHRWLTVDMMTQEALRILRNNLVFATQREHNFFQNELMDAIKLGAVFNIQKPPRYIRKTY